MTKKTKIIIAVAAVGAVAAFFLLRKKKEEDTGNINAQEPSNTIGSVAEAQGLIKPGLATQSIVRSPFGSTRLGNSI